MKRKVCILLAVLMAATLLPACSKKEEPKKETKVEKEEPKVEEEPEEEIPANQNLLTGLGDLSEEAIGKRPVAVMVNNIPGGNAAVRCGTGRCNL